MSKGSLALIGFIVLVAALTFKGPLVVTRTHTTQDTVFVQKTVTLRVDTVWRQAANPTGENCSDNSAPVVVLRHDGEPSTWSREQKYVVRTRDGGTRTITGEPGFLVGEAMCVPVWRSSMAYPNDN